MKTIIYLVLFVGMRLGELAGLEWKNFDFDNKIMQIRRASQYLNDKRINKDERIITKKPKNKKSIRVVSIPQELIDVLKEYKRWQNKERLKLGDKWQREEKEKYGAIIIMTGYSPNMMVPPYSQKLHISGLRNSGKKTIFPR